VNKKTIIFYSGLIISVILSAYYYHFSAQKKKYTIGIIQCASNKPLDTLVKSYRETIQTLLHEDVEILWKNNQGSYLEASAIGEQMHFNKDIDLICAIGSSAALGIAKYETVRPIVVGGISDPVMFDFDKKNNIYGIVDIFDYNTLFTYIIKKYCPKKISLLRSNSNAAEKEAAPFIDLCRKNDIECHELVVNNELDIVSLLETQIAGSDILVIPCDTLVVSAFSYIAQKCKLMSLPLLTCFLDGLEIGATDVIGVDYIEYGAHLAELSCDLLHNQPVATRFGISRYSTLQ
jgi:ABC-type uncharacterized transport system substrate-binding protein